MTKDKPSKPDMIIVEVEKPAHVEEMTPRGKVYFNKVKRIIPLQHDDDSPGDTPTQSR